MTLCPNLREFPPCHNPGRGIYTWPRNLCFLASVIWFQSVFVTLAGWFHFFLGQWVVEIWGLGISSNSWFSCECQGGMLEGLGTEVILSGWPQQIGWWRRGCWFMGKFVCCFRDSDRECMGWWSNYSSYETERSKKKRHFSYFKLSYILIHWWKILLVSLE